MAVNVAAIRTTKALRLAFLEHILRKEVWYFDKQGNGAIASQVTTNGNKINSGISEKLTILMSALSQFSTAFIVALAVQWKLALITMTVIPAILVINFTCISIDAPIEARIGKIYSEAAVLAEEAFASVRTVKAFWAIPKVKEQYDRFLQRAHTEGNKLSLIYAVLFSTEYFCLFCGIALAYWQGYRMFRNGEVPDVGKVFTVVFSVLIASASVSSLLPTIQAFINASAAAVELFGILDKPTQLDPLSEQGETPEDVRGQIEIQDVKFCYPTRPEAQVLKGLSLSIPANKTTALVGPSGCGKSTLVGLVERWYEKESGQIMLDGLDISKLNTRWLRKQIGLVQQVWHFLALQCCSDNFQRNQCCSAEQYTAMLQTACLTA